MRRLLLVVVLAATLLVACDGETGPTESPISPLPETFTWEGFQCQRQEDGAVRCERHEGDGQTLVCWYWPEQGGDPVCFYNQE